MEALGITLIIWGVSLIGIGAVVIFWGIRFLKTAKAIKKDTEIAAMVADKRLRDQYNRIATLPVTEFHNFLATMFSRCMETMTDQEVSTKDPNGKLVLYTKALEDLLLYLGPETISAIDYYYGKDYIIRWASNAFKLLEKRGIVKTMISNKAVKADAIQKEIQK